jgi:DNA-binding winged helix-turn-helix (wHTH) protein
LSFRFADFEINLARQELRRAGTTVHIEPQVFDLLVHLIRNRDRLVPKDELFDVIWQGRIVSEATLNSRISAARRVLGDSGSDQSFIRTLHKRGFRFVGHIDEDDSAPTALVNAQTPPSRGAADGTAKVASPDEPLPLPHPPSIAVPDEDGFADGLAAAAPRPAISDRASDAAGHAIFDADRGPDPAFEGPETVPKVRRSARTPLLAVAVIGLVLLPASAA